MALPERRVRAPAIVRPAGDSPKLPLTLGGAVLCGLAGYFVVVARCSPDASEPEVDNQAAVAPADAGVTARVTPDAGRPAAAPPTPAPQGPSLPVTVRAGAFMGCADGEEINLAPADCDVPAGVEASLRARLAVVLAQCPSAAVAARDPQAALSLGLRVDRTRRRVAVLLGRSSTVAEKVTFVPCVRDALGPMEDLWSVAAQHPRYLWYFTARFGPLPAGFVAPTAAPVPVPVPVPEPAPAPVAAPPPPAPVAAPTAPPPATTPATTSAEAPAGLPAPAEILRMRVITRTTTVWNVTIVRDAPRVGAVVARLPHGTAVEIVDRRGGWYAIRWDRDHTGWAFREPLGQ